MVDFAPTPATVLMETATGVLGNAPVLGNGAILADSVCTTGRAALNFYCSPSPLGRVCFGTSCIFGVAGAVSSGTALATSAVGLPVAGVVGSLGARSFNRLGKYALHLGNVTSGNVTNVTEIAELMG